MPDPHTRADGHRRTRGRLLGIDVGSVRIGVAVCDPDGILATPVETIKVVDSDPNWAAEIRRLVAELEHLGERVARRMGRSPASGVGRRCRP